MVEEGLISVSFLEDKPFAIYNYSLKSIVLTEPSDIELYSIDGKKLHQSSNQSVIPFTHSGIVLVRNINENKTQRLFVPD